MLFNRIRDTLSPNKIKNNMKQYNFSNYDNICSVECCCQYLLSLVVLVDKQRTYKNTRYTSSVHLRKQMRLVQLLYILICKGNAQRLFNKTCIETIISNNQQSICNVNVLPYFQNCQKLEDQCKKNVLKEQETIGGISRVS